MKSVIIKDKESKEVLIHIKRKKNEYIGKVHSSIYNIEITVITDTNERIKLI